MRFAILATILALAACGVDGPPQKPKDVQTTRPAVSISGEIGMGVSGRL